MYNSIKNKVSGERIMKLEYRQRLQLPQLEAYLPPAAQQEQLCALLPDGINAVVLHSINEK
jgi:hypothetical protein